jgi:hypothetical protein
VNAEEGGISVYDWGFSLYPSERALLTVRNYYLKNDGTSNFTNFTNIFPYEIDRRNTFFPWGPITGKEKRNVLSINYAWEANEKWALAVSGSYDFANAQSLNRSLVVRRYFHKWVLDVGFAYDRGSRNTAISFNLSPRETTSSFVKRRQEYGAADVSGQGGETP